MLIEPGRLIVISHEKGGWLHPRHEFNTKTDVRLPQGTPMLVLEDFGTVRIWYDGAKRTVKRLEVLTPKGHGWVYVANY